MTKQSKALARSALSIALFVILMEVLFESFLVRIYEGEKRLLAFSLLLVYMFLQIICAPMQSGISDFTGRKKGLQTSLFVSCLSLVFLILYVYAKAALLPLVTLLFIATFLKGLLGNNLPLSLSLIADTQGKNYRFSFALSSGTYAVAFLFSIYFNNVTTNFILISLAVLLLIVCMSPWFRDVEDKQIDEKEKKTNHNLSLIEKAKHEPRLIKKELKQRSTRQALMAFILWEISIYIVLISQLDFEMYRVSKLATSMMIGYLLGVVILLFCKKVNDSIMMKAGYIVSTFSLVPYFLLNFFSIEHSPTLLLCFGLHSVGNAFLSPTLMSILAKEKPPHEQGKRYGLVESSDTIAFLIGTFTCMLFHLFKVPFYGIASFSLFSFILSWKFYERFQKIN